MLVGGDFAEGGGGRIVVQVADDEQVDGGIFVEGGADVVVQQAGLVAAHFGLAVGVEDLGLEMGDHQAEAVCGADLDVDLDDAAHDGELRGADGVGVVDVRMARDDGETRQDRQIQFGFSAPEVFLVAVFESGLAEAVLEFGPGGGVAHFLDGEDVGGDLPDDVDDGLGFLAGFRLESVGRAVAVHQGVLVEVEGHHGELAGRRAREGGRAGRLGRGGGTGRAPRSGPGEASDGQTDEGGRRGLLHGGPTFSGRRRKCAGRCRGT